MTSKLFELLDGEVQLGAQTDDPRAGEGEASRLDRIAESLTQLDQDESHEPLISAAYGLAEEYKALGRSEEPDYRDRDEGGMGMLTSSSFSVDRLFEDL
jgi:hypothetical protein